MTNQESAKHMPGELPLFFLYFPEGNARAKTVAAKSFPTGARKTAVFAGSALTPRNSTNSYHTEFRNRLRFGGPYTRLALGTNIHLQGG